MKAISFTSFAAILVLGACSHYSDDLASMDSKMGTTYTPVTTAMAVSPQDIAPAAGGPVSTEILNQSLAREYYAMAKEENTKAFDYKAAKQYTEKAKMASAGKLVVPSKISAFDVPAARTGELTEARAELITALKTQNHPENQPALAKAQTSFDCWLERAEEAADDAHFATCKNEFQQSMASLIATAAGAPESAATAYDVMFAENSAFINEASQKDLEYIANLLNKPENAPYTATVTGFTGTAQGEYANNMANARVIAVRDALAARGVAANRVNAVVSGAAEVASAGPRVQVTLVPGAANTHPNVQTKTEYVPIQPIQVTPGTTVIAPAAASMPAPAAVSPQAPNANLN